ncbi:Gfo/Idh/MocA family oxidoreductase [Hymenobacter sp. YC55]|uniref:Gfo/Idh/MocA family protein n=1 Tax=Hymenobacter sp. YC55 TaxID=3034019 RepID=UPI0023F7E2DB|nr:Gfo/Idh/MocA family oxidoreductase [Hymenobacter sp. YC55]MDF7812303.1 Gfo/Idh/MocA family oxidoreductase [Hymenobacter sp. YC55]
MKTFDPQSSASRREFMRTLSLGVGATLAGTSALGGSLSWLDEISYGPASLEALQTGKQLGVALVGLGGYSSGQLAPALQKTKLCKLAGIVTGTPSKAAQWKQQYQIPDQNIYDYKTFDRIADNPAIDIIYIVLPVGLHAEYVERAAKAGKHVICEKPMANTAADCRRMITAMQKSGKKFSIGYRLHFEPHNQEMMRLGQQKVFGPIQKLTADNGFQAGSKTWRQDKELAGGGPLMDMGIYCVQGVIYTKGELPVSVTAKFGPKTDPVLFNEVEASINWQMQFADGAVANCRTSYAENMNSLLRADATKGWMELQPAYGYGGLDGRTSQGPMNVENVPQQARQMDDFADCILNNKPTRVPGEMGLRDMQIIEAIYRAAETGQKVSTKDVVAVFDKVSVKK